MNATVSDILASERNCYLTTTGRTTGKPHEIEIWFAATGDTLYMLSGGMDRSDWVKNLRHNPQVTVRIGETVLEGHARFIDAGTTDEQQAREMLARKYQGWKPGNDLSQWARESLPIAIELDGASR